MTPFPIYYAQQLPVILHISHLVALQCSSVVFFYSGRILYPHHISLLFSLEVESFQGIMSILQILLYLLTLVEDRAISVAAQNILME